MNNLDKDDNQKFSGMLLPLVKNVSSKLLADDIKPFNPNNPKHVREWGEVMKSIWDNVKRELDEKGIPMPKIVIDTTPGPITYGVRTVDENGDEIHRFIPNDDE